VGLSEEELRKLHGGAAPISVPKPEPAKKAGQKLIKKPAPRTPPKGTRIPKVPKAIQEQLDVFELWIAKALDRSELDPGQGAVMRMLLAQVPGLKPEKRVATFKELARIRGLYSAKSKVMDQRPPSELSTLELIQVIGHGLGLVDWQGVTPSQLPDPTPADYSAVSVPTEGMLDDDSRVI